MVKTLAMLILIASFNNQSVYMKGMEITSLDYEKDIVYCMDSVGFEWAFYGCEDYMEGDIIYVLLDDNGTKETIFDDIIVNVNYSGYRAE